MNPKYTLIAYKPDSTESSMGCHMQDYSSDLQIFTNLDADSLTAKMAEINAIKYDNQESPHQMTVLSTGDSVTLCMFDENDISETSSSFDAERCDFEEKEIAEVVKAAAIKSKELIVIREQKEKAQAEQKALAKAQKKENEEKELFKTLLAKYKIIPND